MRHCYVLRVFTRGDTGGNPLGVVTDVTGLGDEKMQRIAFDLGFSETVFLDWRAGGTPKARIFTPATELPFAGHPLVGAGWVLGVLGPAMATAVSCEVAEVPFRVDGDMVWIEAPSGQPVSSASITLEGVTPRETRRVDMPLAYVVVQVEDPETVASFSAPPAEDTLYLWAWEDEGRTVKARFFASEHGVVEDPATGSAAVALAAVLREAGMSEGDVVIHQGDEIDAPSSLLLRWTGDAVTLGGSVRRDEVRVLGT